MPKQKITISLDSEIAEKLRLQSMKKYGNSRSMSRLIEDLATGAAKAEQPEACSILGQRSEYSYKAESEFKKTVDKIAVQLSEIKVYDENLGETFPIHGTPWYFALKEACELRINELADIINKCHSCHGLDNPAPKYETAGKNFAIYATMNNLLR